MSHTLNDNLEFVEDTREETAKLRIWFAEHPGTHVEAMTTPQDIDDTYHFEAQRIEDERDEHLYPRATKPLDP